MKQAVIWALQAGYRHIDCAAIYGNEAEVGEALHQTVGPGKVELFSCFYFLYLVLLFAFMLLHFFYVQIF